MRASSIAARRSCFTGVPKQLSSTGSTTLLPRAEVMKRVSLALYVLFLFPYVCTVHYAARTYTFVSSGWAAPNVASIQDVSLRA